MCILAIVTFPNDSNPVDGKNIKYATHAEKVVAKRCANATGRNAESLQAPHTWLSGVKTTRGFRRTWFGELENSYRSKCHENGGIRRYFKSKRALVYQMQVHSAYRPVAAWDAAFSSRSAFTAMSRAGVQTKCRPMQPKVEAPALPRRWLRVPIGRE
jgi:hypothetical protein